MTYDPKTATLGEAAAYRAGLLRAAEIAKEMAWREPNGAGVIASTIRAEAERAP
jgi:hypothetical protein